MNKRTPFKRCSAVSREQIRVKHTKTLTLLQASFMHGEHETFKEHVENNPEHQNLYGSLKRGIELVISKRRTMSDVAPTLITLLQNGAQWDCDHLIMSGGITPYHVICRSNGDHHELLELMIKELRRTLLNAKDDVGCTALMYAVLNANIKCVKCLIANEADVNLINNKPNVIHMTTVVTGPLIDSINLLHPSSRHSYNTMMGIFDVLLGSGADVNKPCFGRVAIMEAAALGNVNCVEKLLQKGAQVNYTDKIGETVWRLAVRAGSVDVLKLLIEDNGIDKNSTDEKGLSLLYWAVHSGNIEAVRYLLKQEVTMTSFVPQECVEACRKCGTNVSCHYPDATQIKIDPSVLAIRFNMLDIVRLMNEYGCQLYKYPEILSYAIRENNVQLVDYLLSNYKYPLNYEYIEKYNDSRLNSDHQTFLNIACEEQSVKMVKLLLKHGADPNKKCCTEKCPNVINVVIYDRHVDVLACLIRGGVNVNTRCYHARMSMGRVLPFEIALYKNHIYAAEMLLVAGCSRGVHSWNNNHTLKVNIGREMQELLKEWSVHKNNVLPLKQRCRMVILNHLCPQADKKITELPLPPQLIKYLSIPELDDIETKHLSANS